MSEDKSKKITKADGTELTDYDLQAYRLLQDAETQKNIDGPHGQSVVSVFDPEGTSPTFTYTIGRAEQGKTELYVVGLSPEVATWLLNTIAAEERKGNPPTPSVLMPEMLGGDGEFAVTFDNLHPDTMETMHLSWRRASEHGNGFFSALQVIYPDTNGVWPWNIEEPSVFHMIEPCRTLCGSWQPYSDDWLGD